jgi:DNA repair protein RecN (Recombination protein N)
MADSHFLIEKENDASHTATSIRSLNREDSVEELARILGGAKITDAIRNSAREMKDLADKEKLRF